MSNQSLSKKNKTSKLYQSQKFRKAFEHDEEKSEEENDNSEQEPERALCPDSHLT